MERPHTSVKDFVREARPAKQAQFERRFETPPGKQAQVDFAEFAVEFTDEPGVVRKVWLFSMVLGYSRWLWGRFCASQNLQTVMRCHVAAFAAMGGAPMCSPWPRNQDKPNPTATGATGSVRSIEPENTLLKPPSCGKSGYLASTISIAYALSC